MGDQHSAGIEEPSAPTGGQLLRVIHDLNNLIGAIANYAHFVAEELRMAQTGVPRDWAAVGRDVARIQLAAERLTALTQQLAGRVIDE